MYDCSPPSSPTVKHNSETSDEKLRFLTPSMLLTPQRLNMASTETIHNRNYGTFNAGLHKFSKNVGTNSKF
jgi:hypothetical protein